MKKRIAMLTTAILASQLFCPTIALSEPASNQNASSGVGQQDEFNITTQPSEEIMSSALEALGDSGVMSMNAGTDFLTAQDPEIRSFSGADRFEVANSIALAAFPTGCTQAIIAGSGGWPDALGATSLAGALDCPILLTSRGGLTRSTRECLADLGVTSVIIVGGPNTVSPVVEEQLRGCGIAVSERLGGADRYEVQMNIYARLRGTLSSRYVLVASGSKFPDALSASPLTFAEKAPIFLADGSGSLSAAQREALGEIARSRGDVRFVIVGGPASVSARTESFLKGLSATVRLGGADRYEASANFAEWAADEGLLAWEGAAFTTGAKPYDALTGCSLQGRERSVMLLINGGDSLPVTKFVSSGSRSLKFFGGTASVPEAWRTAIVNRMNSVSPYDAGTSLASFAKAEAQASPYYTEKEILQWLDPENFSYSSSDFYQFADISKGYSGKISAQQIDSFVAGVCNRNGYTSSTLLGMGSTIIQAAKQYNINEVYLLSHAILESGWGMSALSQGRVSGYEGYYNFFGIGAYDKDPLNGGGYLAKSKGWNTPQKGMLGAAEWISKNYIHNSDGQNTLYKMRWNTKTIWHQYATDSRWASSIARVMGSLYSTYGYTTSNAGLTYLYPVYR